MLGEAGSVRTTKSLDEPCGGFSITFADKQDPTGLDTIYGLVEPMDLAEIRIAREPWRYAGGKLPIIMRGFVSVIRRLETLSPDGTPKRTVVLQGQDMGKLWQIHQLLPETIYAANTSPYMATYDLFASLGIQVKYLQVSEFMRQLTETVMNAKVAAMAAWTGAYLPPFAIQASVPEGQVSCSLVKPFKGPFWNLAELVADRPWNELFIQDTEAGPNVIFRPAPYKDIYSDAFIMPGATDPGTIYRTSAEVVSWDVQRTDSRTANFYWTEPGSSILDTSGLVNVASLQTGSLQDFTYPNSAVDLYGLKKMEVDTSLLPLEVSDTPIRFNGQQRIIEGSKVIQWHTHRAQQIKAMNRDNSALEEISATFKGSEEFQVGKYLQLTRGQIVSTGYIIPMLID